MRGEERDERIRNVTAEGSHQSSIWRLNDEAFVLEDLDALPQGRARHVELHGKIALGQEVIAGAEGTFANEILQVARRALGSACAPDRA